MVKATLSLEHIGFASDRKVQAFDRMCFGIGRRVGPWVARVVGALPDGKLQLDFLPSKTNYARANAKASRGVELWYILETGRLYKVHERVSWQRSVDYFCSVTPGGKITKLALTNEEALAWLKRV